jgi:hypothetical protein
MNISRFTNPDKFHDSPIDNKSQLSFSNEFLIFWFTGLINSSPGGYMSLRDRKQCSFLQFKNMNTVRSYHWSTESWYWTEWDYLCWTEMDPNLHVSTLGTTCDSVRFLAPRLDPCKWGRSLPRKEREMISYGNVCQPVRDTIMRYHEFVFQKGNSEWIQKGEVPLWLFPDRPVTPCDKS